MDNHFTGAGKMIELAIRKAVKEAGGTMPEDLPTPSRSLKEIKKENTLIK